MLCVDSYATRYVYRLIVCVGVKGLLLSHEYTRSLLPLLHTVTESLRHAEIRHAYDMMLVTPPPATAADVATEAVATLLRLPSATYCRHFVIVAIRPSRLMLAIDTPDVISK